MTTSSFDRRTPFEADLLQDDRLTRGVLSRRIVAWWVDLLIIAVLCAVLWSGLFAFGVITLGLGMPLLGLLPAVPFFYNWLFLASRMAATPGQALLGLTVVRNEDFDRPSPLEALVSTAGFYLTMALGVIWLGAALLTVRHRTLHDLLSGLVVVRSRALTAPDGGWNMRGGGFPAA